MASADRRTLLKSKFVFSLVGSLLVVEGLVLLSNATLRSDRMTTILQAYTAAAICVGLSGLTVGMGALFPNLRERSPSKIVSGFGGTLTLILSVFMVAIVVIPEAVACHIAAIRHENEAMVGNILPWMPALCLAWATAVALPFAWIPMRLGRKALERMEF
jgi:ABC-2 type transport system permease protein